MKMSRISTGRHRITVLWIYSKLSYSIAIFSSEILGTALLFSHMTAVFSR